MILLFISDYTIFWNVISIQVLLIFVNLFIYWRNMMTADKRIMARIWTCGLVPAPPDAVDAAGWGTQGQQCEERR